MKIITQKARILRRDQTGAEKLIWRHLRNRQLGGFKFKRQHPVFPYITDFFCQDYNLIVEIDGGQHSPEADQKRTDYLTGKGYKIIRFWNNEVLENIEGVLSVIEQTILTSAFPHPPADAGPSLSLRERVQ